MKNKILASRVNIYSIKAFEKHNSFDKIVFNYSCTVISDENIVRTNQWNVTYGTSKTKLPSSPIDTAMDEIILDYNSKMQKNDNKPLQYSVSCYLYSDGTEKYLFDIVVNCIMVRNSIQEFKPF